MRLTELHSRDITIDEGMLDVVKKVVRASIEGIGKALAYLGGFIVNGSLSRAVESGSIGVDEAMDAYYADAKNLTDDMLKGMTPEGRDQIEPMLNQVQEAFQDTRQLMVELKEYDEDKAKELMFKFNELYKDEFRKAVLEDQDAKAIRSLHSSVNVFRDTVMDYVKEAKAAKQDEVKQRADKRDSSELADIK